MKKYLAAAFILSLSFPCVLWAQQVQVLPESSSSPVVVTSGPAKSGVGGDPNFFQGKTKIGNIFSLRDPFKSGSIVKKTEKTVRGGNVGLIRNGVFTNRPSIDGVPLEKIKIIGVLIGKDRRALARITGEKGNDKDAASVVTLREGMKIGQNNAELKAILPGGVVLVEKIQNVYGQDEYLETVIPISQN